MHDHSHGHSHTHSGGHGAERRLKLSLVAIGSFMLVEGVTGWLSGSLALLADAGHMLSDAGALTVALVAARLAARPPDRHRSLGWGRAEVLGAALNATILLLIAGGIVAEAVERLQQGGHEIDAVPMLAVASLGLVVNLAVAWVLTRGETQSINLRAALWHVLGDALGSVGAIAAAVAILAGGWSFVDAAASLLIAIIISVGALRILRETARVLMQTVPPSIDLDQVRARLAALDGVTEVHALHLWSMAPGENVLSVHVVLAGSPDPVTHRAFIERQLREALPLRHVTIQVETEDSRCSKRA